MSSGKKILWLVEIILLIATVGLLFQGQTANAMINVGVMMILGAFLTPWNTRK